MVRCCGAGGRGGAQGRGAGRRARRGAGRGARGAGRSMAHRDGTRGAGAIMRRGRPTGSPPSRRDAASLGPPPPRHPVAHEKPTSLAGFDGLKSSRLAPPPLPFGLPFVMPGHSAGLLCCAFAGAYPVGSNDLKPSKPASGSVFFVRKAPIPGKRGRFSARTLPFRANEAWFSGRRRRRRRAPTTSAKRNPSTPRRAPGAARQTSRHHAIVAPTVPRRAPRARSRPASPERRATSKEKPGGQAS